MDKLEWIIGAAAQTLVVLAGLYAMILRNDWSSKDMREQLKGVREELKKLAEVITLQAVQSTRLDNHASQLASLDRRVEDLRRGRGRVVEAEEDN